MGRSKESKNTRQRIDTEYNRAGNQTDDFFNQLMGNFPTVQQRGNDAYNTALGGYNSLLSSGGEFNPLVEEGYENLAGGGVDDDAKRRIRGNNYFEELERTGGYSPEDILKIRSRSNRSIPSFFESLKGNLQRSRAQGRRGLSLAETGALSREGARGAHDAAIDTELDIKDRVNTGRLTGARGMSEAELSLESLIGGNKRTGLAGLFGLGESKTQTRQQALSGIRGLRTDVSGEESMYLDNLFRTIGLGAAQRAQLLGLYQNQDQLDNQRRQALFNAIGQALGIAGQIASGGKKPTATMVGY